MSNPNVKPRFKKGSPEASEAGKKSKRGKSIKTIIKNIMSIPADKLINMTEDEKKKLPKELQDMTGEEMMWYRAMCDAMSGDKDARRDIADRLEGKAVQAVNANLSGSMSVNIGTDDTGVL
jgi:hypothetical protein